MHAVQKVVSALRMSDSCSGSAKNGMFTGLEHACDGSRLSSKETHFATVTAAVSKRKFRFAITLPARAKNFSR